MKWPSHEKMKFPFKWMVLRAPPEKSVVLDRRRIYILPTKQGMLFALILFLMLTGSINYGLSLGFALTFLLAGMSLVSIFHAFANLEQLRIEPGKVAPVFAGEPARFSVHLENGARVRHDIGLRAGGTESFHDVGTGKAAVAEFTLPTTKRGLLAPGRFTLFTLYPLGLFRAWAYAELTMPCLVYPSPAVPFAHSPESDSNTGATPYPGYEDFSGLRVYRPGDSPRHIAWKSFARGRELQVKEFDEFRGGGALWLDWGSLDGDVETRLSKLVRMALDAHSAGRRFGLRLPRQTIPLGIGEQHKLRVLEALALFEP